MDTLALQRELIAAGFDVGPRGADGVPGRMTTAAVIAFQKARGLNVKWPGTVGPLTIAALLGAPQAAVAPVLTPPWFELAGTKKGLTELKDKAALAEFLKSDGHALGDPSKLPWCGDFVQTCIAVTVRDEPLPNNSYLARNWLKFGVRLAEPALGAVLIFWRGSKAGTSGHVGFYAGERKDAFLVRGGNQSDSISDAWLRKDRLLGARWPATWPLPTAGRTEVGGAGALSTNEA